MVTSDIFTNQRKVWKDHKLFYAIAGRSIPFVVGVIVGGIVFSSDAGYATNLYTEILSIIATVLVLDFTNDYRRKREQADRDQLQAEEQRQRDQLAREEQRKSNQLQAISEIQRTNTKEERQSIIDHMKADNLLEGANLRKTNLAEADLGGANLAEADLENANLEGADLRSASLARTDLGNANLIGADLKNAYLEDAYLGGANLKDANLGSANLKGAILRNANLEGANLRWANLEGTDLWSANLAGANLVDATLPDGTQWTSDTDLARFTDSDHPDYQATRGKINTIRKEMGLDLIRL